MPDPSSDASVRPDCPRCAGPLETVQADAAARVHTCARCGGIFVPARAWCLLADRPEIAKTIEARLAKPEIPRHTLLAFLRCPSCGSQMERGRFAATTSAVVDVCTFHGVWFDAEELPLLTQMTSDPESRRARDEQMEALEREQRVAYTIAFERDRMRVTDRSYDWKVVGMAVVALVVLARVFLYGMEQSQPPSGEHASKGAAASASPKKPMRR